MADFGKVSTRLLTSIKYIKTYVAFTVLTVFATPEAGLQAQDIKIVPQTPNAMKLTEYQIQRPLLYTGTANVSIPLYTIDFDGMTVPISISYAATGVRTNEEAGEVGLGWALNATAVISRTVRGGDDLFQGNRKGYAYNEQAVNHDLGYAYNDPNVPTVPEVIPVDSYYQHLVWTKPDTEPDVFNYNFFGFSGSFVLSQKVATNDTIKVLKLTQDACVVTFNEAAKTFTIITPTGFRGDFLVKEFSTSFSYITTDFSLNNGNAWNESSIDILQSQNEGRFRTITSWYLKQITSPRGELLTFNYDLNPNGSSSFVSNSRSHIEVPFSEWPAVSQTIHEHIYLKEIIGQDVKVDFSMENREDLRINSLYTVGVNPYFPLGRPLKRYKGITVSGISSRSTLNKVINFDHGYFNDHRHDQLSGNQAESELRWLRSRLDRMTIDDQEYNFFYEKGLKGVPDKLTNGIDHFGFYNGRDDLLGVFPPTVEPGTNSCSIESQNYLVPAYYRQNDTRIVGFDYGKAGLLSKVIYPTRGYTLFEFEPHQYQADWRGVFRESFLSMSFGIAGGARIRSVKDYSEFGLLQKSKSYQYVEIPDSPPNAATTTGKLMVPLYNRYTQLARNPYDSMKISRCNYVYNSNSSIPGNNAAEGKVIGYSKVHEFVEGSGRYRTTYYFENTPSDVLDGNAASHSFERVNGHQKEIRRYNDAGQIVQRTQSLDYHHQVGNVKAIAYTGNFFDPLGFAYVAKYFLTQNFTTPFQTVSATVDLSNPMVEDASGVVTSPGASTISVVSHTFNSHFQLQTETTTGSSGETIVTEYRRPTDYTTKSAALQHMVSPTVNLVEPVIESWTRKNGVLIQGQGVRYEYDNVNNRVNPTAQFAINTALGGTLGSPDGFNFPSPYEWRGTYTYNTNSQSGGKLEEYVLSDGLTHSFIWGDGAPGPLTNTGRFLMAHGVGISFAQLSAAYNDAVASPNFNIAIRDHALTSKKPITTYTHNPLVGVTQVTDPGNKAQTYHYDPFGRLKNVKDHAGRVLESYDYNFKKRQPTRILSLSGNLNFGTLTNDMFAVQYGPYDRCSDPLRDRTLTISNLGEDDLIISSVIPPPGFTVSWPSGTIRRGNAVDVIVSFNKYENLPLGDYSGTIQVNSSNMTSGDSSLPVSVNYVARTVGLSFDPVSGITPKLFDMGTTTGGIYGVPLQVTNTSNGPLRLAALPLDWDGTPNSYHTYTNPDFSLSYFFTEHQGDETAYSQCVLPGQTVNVSVTFNPPPGGPNGVRSTKLSIITDIPPAYWSTLSFKDVVTIQANLQRPVSVISMNTNPISLGNFTESSRSETILISNPGNLGFSVDGLSFSDQSHAQHFTLSPSNFLINPGQSHPFTLTFHPTLFELNLTTSITIVNNAMAGNDTFTFSGNRYRYRKLELSTNISNNELLFNNQFETRSVTITNSISSNDNLYVSGYSPPNTSLEHFQVSSFSAGTLMPGQSLDMQVFRTGASPSNNEIISIISNKTDGGNTFTPKGNTREIKLSAVAFPFFTSATSSQPMTVSNTGNAPLNITDISSSNGRFSAFPTSFIVAPGGSQMVTVTYSSVDFSLQSTTFTVYSNKTNIGGNTIATSAQRSAVRTISASPSSLNFEQTYTDQLVSITNAGNDVVTLYGVQYSYVGTGTYSDTSIEWSATVSPSSISPGQSATLRIKAIKTHALPQFIRVTYNKTSDYSSSDEVLVEKRTRNINLSPGSLSFTDFSGTSQTRNVTVTNSGNSQVDVSSYSSSNDQFSLAPASFSIPAGGSQSLSVTFSPINFESQSATISFIGNQTTGNTLSVSGQRMVTRIIQVAPTQLAFDGATFTPQYSTVSNVGNSNLTITGITNPNTIDWDVSVFGLPVTLAPGQTTSVTIQKKKYQPQQPLTFNIISNKTDGNETVQVTANPPTRIISLSPSSVTFPSFSASTATQSVTITNSGNSQVDVSSYSSSNDQFSLAPASFSIPAGGSQSLSVTFSPINFESQSATISFIGNQTTGNTLSVSGQRTKSYALSLSRSEIIFNYTGQTESVTITNSGNQSFPVSGILNNSPFEWSVSITPKILLPNETLIFTVTRTTHAQVGTYTITVDSSGTGNKVITLKRLF